MKKVLLATTCLMLTACTTVQPRKATPIGMPTAYDFARENESITEQDTVWWEHFGDPALSALIEQALAENQDIEAGLAAVRASRAAVRVTNASLYPQLSAGGSANSNSDDGLDDFSASARGTASYQLDLFGQNQASRASATANYESQYFNQRTLELTISSDVAFNYFSVLTLRHRLEVAQSNLTISERINEIVKARYEAGSVSRFDLTSQEAAVANARARLPQIEQQLVSIETALAILLGQTPQGYAAPSGELLAMVPPDINPGLPSDLLLRRPDLLSAEAQLRAADADIAGARAAFFPSIDLSAGVNAGLTGGTSVLGTLASSLSVPIFSGGRLEGQLESANARADQQLARYRQATLNALRDVDVSLSALTTAEKREVQLEIARRASDQSLQLAELRYKTGADDLTSLLNAQTTAFNAADSLFQGRLDRLSAAIDLFVAMGGGWADAPTWASL
ncbi:efflux transporter outer membrane subunit [Hyphococcus lacteus]|uniref:Efflux transporter outer membrane subunit n=1 Tax=Hyphococcus lacteus TaxID=3143536 RepID=A0ABV3Z806_9PROT